ncbi:MAG: histidine kinase dimerization/phospho-acceptor domain-containing protein, partial [Ostreibacterium sp.]
MFRKIQHENLSEDIEKFPILLLQPWRTQQLVDKEFAIHRYHLFQTITLTRIIFSIIVLIILFIFNYQYSSKLIIACYSILIIGFLLISKSSHDKINYYSFVNAFLDILILGYIATSSENRIEIGFIFFSIIFSSILLQLFPLMIVVILAAIVVTLGWSNISLENIKSFFISTEPTPHTLTIQNILFQPNDLQALSVLIAGLFFLAIITNRLTHWSLTNEVKAQFRYKQLRQVLSFNRSIIEHLKSGVLVFNPDGKIISINRRAVELLNLKSSTAVIQLKDLSLLLVRRFRLWLEGDGLDNSFSYRHNTGAEEVFVSFSGFGQSEQKKIIMMTLESVNETLEQTQEEKLSSLGRLTASVAHEIRNPLSSIHSAAQLLLESTKDPTQRKLTQLMLKNVKRTNQIINDILGLFKEQKADRKLLSLRTTLDYFKI